MSIIAKIIGAVSSAFSFVVTKIKSMFKKETKVAPFPANSDYWKSRVAQHAASPTKGEVMMIGDSITDGQSVYANVFPRVCNRGISGDTTMGVLDRLPMLLAEKPRKVFLLIGTNNFGWGTPEAAARVVGDIITIARAFKAGGAQVYVQSILPVNTSCPLVVTRSNQQVIEANIKLFGHAQTTGEFVFVPLYASFADEAGMLKKEYTFDGLHLNEQGYKKWAEIVSPLMS